MQISQRAIMRQQDLGPPGPLSMLFAPIARFQDTEPLGKLVAVLAALAQLAWGDFFVLAVVLLFLAGGWDWAWGRSIARVNGTFDPRISTWGWQSKVSGLGLGLFLRLAEERAEAADVFVTHGWVATACVLVLLFHEIRSIDKKRQGLGGPPLPLLGWFLDLGDRALANMVPHLQQPTSGRRASDSAPVSAEQLQDLLERRRGAAPGEVGEKPEGSNGAAS